MRGSDVERWEALARNPRPRKRRGRGSIIASITAALLVIATLALAEDLPGDETATPTPTETQAPEPSPDTSPSPDPEPSPADEAPAEPSSGADPSPAPEPSPAAEPAGAPTITSDKDDYPPGGTVVLTGSNWQPGEQVHIRVNDDAGETWRRDVDVVADADGKIHDEFTLPNWFVATYTATATGPVSGTAMTTFTDGAIKVSSNASGVTFTLTWTTYNTTNCSGTTSASGTETVGFSGGAIFNIGVGNTESIKLEASATASTPAGSSFGSWTSASPFTVLAPSRIICVTGFNGGGSRDYVANYATNTAPTISDIADRTINEDASTGAISFTVGDAETAAGSLTLSGSSSNTTLVPNANITFGGSGASRTVTVTPAANKHGAATITVTVSDGSLTANDTFLLTVRSVNDAPSGANNTLVTGEDTAYVFASGDFGFSDPDDAPADGFSAVRIVSLPGAGSLAFNGNPVSAGDEVAVGNLGLLTFAPAPNASGSPYASFTFKVKDDGGTANGGVDLDPTANTITFNVTAANDAPVCDDVSITTDEDVAGSTAPDCDDVDGDALTYSVTAATHGTSGFSAGQITYDPDPDYNGADGFTYTANDGTLDSNAADVDVTVNPVNDAPVADDETVTATEDTDLNTPVTTLLAGDTDVDGDTLTVTAVSGASGGTATLNDNGTALNKADDFVRFSPNANLCGLAAGGYDYTVSDGHGGTDTGHVTVNIMCINDAPDISSAVFASTTVACPTTSGANNATLTVAFDDVDDSTGFTATIDWDSDPSTTSDNEGPFSVSEPSFTRTHSYGAAGTYTATVRVYDAGGLQDTATALVTVNYNVVGGAFKQPVNDTRNGQVTSIFKYGSTIPLKLEITDCNGSHPSGLEIRVTWQKLSGSTPVGVEETAIATNAPDAGNMMRMVDSMYMFNWNTKLVGDQTCTVRIQARIVATGQTIYADIGLKK